MSTRKRSRKSKADSVHTEDQCTGGACATHNAGVWSSLIKDLNACWLDRRRLLLILFVLVNRRQEGVLRPSDFRISVDFGAQFDTASVTGTVCSSLLQKDRHD